MTVFRFVSLSCLTLPLLWMGLEGAAYAQEPPALPLTPISEINRILTDPSRTEPVMMRFRGTVIFVSRGGEFCLQDGEAGLMLERPVKSPRPNMGDLIEIEAPIKFYGPDILDQSFFLIAPTMRNLGPGSLPEPVKSSLLEARRAKWAGRWIELEGVVMQAVQENGVVALHLTDEADWGIVHVHDWPGGDSIQDWWGARVKIRCANVGRSLLSMRATSRDQITVVKPGLDKLFSAPLGDVEALRSGAPTTERLRFRGTVLRSVKNGVYFRAEKGGGVWASYLRPLKNPTLNPSPLELVPPVVSQPLKPGDRVELVGSPLTVQPYLGISFCSFRLLGPGEVPPPRAAAGKPLAAISCDRVTLTGKLQALEANLSGAGPEPKLTLDYGGTPVPVMFIALGPQDLSSFHLGDSIEATGLLGAEDQGHPFLLYAEDASALRVVGGASLSRSLGPVALRWIGGLGAGLIVALAGAWWLRHLVKKRTAALATANETLRSEVAVRHKAEAALAEALKEEREVGELKSSFVTMVSHEFRTPLAVILSSTDILSHYLDRLSPEQREQQLATIRGSTQQMARLIEEVLLLGKVEAGKMAYVPKPMNLPNFCFELVDEVLSATARRCPIALRCADDLPETMLGDSSLLRHIFNNLLSNASKYSPEGAEVTFEAERADGGLLFRVTDKGIGIPAEDQARLFEPFHRGRNVGQTGGTGLGLMITKRCVDLHGGSLALQSAPGVGTTVEVRIPISHQAVQP